MDCAHLNKAQAAPRNSACSERRFEGCKGLFNLAGQDDRTGKRRNVADGRGHCHTRKRHTASRCGHLRKCGVRHLYPEVGEGEGGRDPVIWRFAIEREDWIRRGCRKAGGYHTLYALTPFTVPFLIEFDHARVIRVIELFKKRRQRGTGRCKEAGEYIIHWPLEQAFVEFTAERTGTGTDQGAAEGNLVSTSRAGDSGAEVAAKAAAAEHGCLAG